MRLNPSEGVVVPDPVVSSAGDSELNCSFVAVNFDPQMANIESSYLRHKFPDVFDEKSNRKPVKHDILLHIDAVGPPVTCPRGFSPVKSLIYCVSLVVLAGSVL